MRMLAYLTVCVLLVGCGASKHTGDPLIKVKVTKTEKFVTFVTNYNEVDKPQEYWAQKAAENWMEENPEYEVKNVTTSMGNHSAHRFAITLWIEPKKEKTGQQPVDD